MTKELPVKWYIKDPIWYKEVLVRKARKWVRKDLYRKQMVYKKTPIEFYVSKQDQQIERAKEAKIKKHRSHQEFNTSTSSSWYKERKKKISKMMWR